MEYETKIPDLISKKTIFDIREEGFKPDSCAYFFGLSQNQANIILRYLDLEDILNCRLINKSWNKYISEEAYKVYEEEIYLAYIMWFIYGHENAKRLSCIIDEAIEKYSELYRYKDINDCKDYLSQFVEKEKDDEYNFEESWYYNISNKFGKIGIKSHLWHLLLFGILGIKKSDLKCDLDELEIKRLSMPLPVILGVKKSDLKCDLDELEIKKIKEIDLIHHFHRQIYEHLVGDKFKNLVFSALTSKFNANSSIFRNFVKLLFMDPVKNLNQQIPGTYMINNNMCFLKVAFYKSQCVADNFLKIKDPDIQTLRDVEIWQALLSYCRNEYYFLSTEKVYEHCFMDLMARYLYLTEELEDWLERYKCDFIAYFGKIRLNHSLKPHKKFHVDFKDFLFYLNKIKSFDDRYKANAKSFFKMFFPDCLADTSISKFTHCDELFLNITSYLSPKIIQNVWFNANWHLKGVVDFNKLVGQCQYNCPMDCSVLGKYYKDDPGQLVDFLCDNNRQIKIDEEKLNMYFIEIIIYFFEMKLNVEKWDKKEYEKLPNKDKHFIKFISKIITNTREKDLFKLQEKYDESNKLVNTDNNSDTREKDLFKLQEKYDEPNKLVNTDNNSDQDVSDDLNQAFISDNEDEKNEILSDHEIKISLDIFEEDKNPNKINFINEIKNSEKDNISDQNKTKMSFGISGKDKNPNKINSINEKPDDKNDKNNEISTNNSIKTPMNNMNQASIFDKINDNLDDEAPKLLSYQRDSLNKNNN